MNRKQLLKIGITGTVVTAICCFTPLLVVLLSAVGLSAWLAWLDSLLVPLLVVFSAITAFALMGTIGAARHTEGNGGSTK